MCSGAFTLKYKEQLCLLRHTTDDFFCIVTFVENKKCNAGKIKGKSFEVAIYVLYTDKCIQKSAEIYIV